MNVNAGKITRLARAASDSGHNSKTAGKVRLGVACARRFMKNNQRELPAEAMEAFKHCAAAAKRRDGGRLRELG